MRVLLQRVDEATAWLGDKAVAQIGQGLVVFVGIGQEDDAALVAKMARRIVNLRVLEGDGSKFHRSLRDARGDIMTLSQFTLYGRLRRGQRPDFGSAAEPQMAEILYDHFASCLQEVAPAAVAVGPFGERLLVDVRNWGPFSLWIDSDELWAS